MGRCYAAITGLSTSCLGMTPTRSHGSRRGLGPPDRAVSTVRTYGTVAGEFVAFIGTRGGLACCDATGIEAFVATLAGYQVKTVEQKLCALRSFLKFASAEGLVDAAVADAVPAGAFEQAGQGPVGVGPGRGGKDPATRSTGATRAGSGTTRSSC